MAVHEAVFVKSSARLDQAPPPSLPEYALLGRSNVGKSSLLNALLGRKLAQVSGTPGKTRLLNHYLIDGTWYLADLPGYGFAKRSQKERDEYARLLEAYWNGRPNLLAVLLLLDSRHSPLKTDLDMMQRLGEAGLPLVLVLTKADKLSRNQQAQALKTWRQTLMEIWEDVPPMFLTSAQTGLGLAALLEHLAANLVYFKPQRA